MTTQDLVKGIDITGLADVSGSELNQLIDVGRTAEDKGIIIESTDTALNVPLVPDPNHSYIGIIPLWWRKYVWSRKPFDNTGEAILYVWNEQKVSDATFLKWIDIRTGLLNQANLVTINAAILAAQNAANAAQTTANNAQTDATDAFALAGDTNISLEDFKAGFGPFDGGVVQVDWNQVFNKPLNVSGIKHLSKPVQILNAYSAAPIVETGWLFIDLSPYTGLIPEIDEATNRSGAIIKMRAECQLLGVGGASAEVDGYVNYNNLAVKADSRVVTAKIKRTSPNDTLADGFHDCIMAMTGTKGIYYKWEALNGVENYFQIWLEGFVSDLAKIAN